MIQHYPWNFQPVTPIPQTQQVQQKPQPGFVVVGTEEEALRYPIAPGFSQLDNPIITKYRLVKEDVPEPSPAESPHYALKEDIDRIEEEIEKIRSLLPKRPTKKKEEVEDE